MGEREVKSQKSKVSSQEEEYQYRDPRRVVLYLQEHLADGLARELMGLNPDDAVPALVYAEDRLANALCVVRLCLNQIGANEVGDDDAAESAIEY